MDSFLSKIICGKEACEFLHHQSDDDDDIKLIDLSKEGALNYTTEDDDVKLVSKDTAPVIVSQEPVHSENSEGPTGATNVSSMVQGVNDVSLMQEY